MSNMSNARLLLGSSMGVRRCKRQLKTGKLFGLGFPLALATWTSLASAAPNNEALVPPVLSDQKSTKSGSTRPSTGASSDMSKEQMELRRKDEEGDTRVGGGPGSGVRFAPIVGVQPVSASERSKQARRGELSPHDIRVHKGAAEAQRNKAKNRRQAELDAHEAHAERERQASKARVEKAFADRDRRQAELEAAKEASRAESSHQGAKGAEESGKKKSGVFKSLFGKKKK
jgi:hypothetical protein